MSNKIDFEYIVDMILTRCEEQSRYYREIAYNSDYKEQTIERIVNLGIAYNDIKQYIELLVEDCSKKQSPVAKATRLGFPTTVGQAIADCNDYNKTACTETKNLNIVQPTVAQTEDK